ncbi:RidA family protein [Halomonas sp. PR-M31]|uniref:RidA family protein n=1 Tax=Halomonas sp. PR-M31 TaxID=1471202 RepID=UPI0006515225|nr:RidA family protein [Halomonas sp. PR-M31]
MQRIFKPAILAGVLLAATASAQAADNVTRHSLKDSDFPISLAVETGPQAQTLYLSGSGPEVSNQDADENTIDAYGDMETQARSALTSIADKLEGLGYDMSDVVMMHAYLVPDSDTGKLDFEGFMNAYTEFFGTDDQPNLPARSAVPVPQLANPGWLIEIEVTAAK